MISEDPRQPAGVAPLEPDEPVSIEAYEAMIAAMDAMIAEADEPGEPVQEATYQEVLHPRGRGGKWIEKLFHESDTIQQKAILRQNKAARTIRQRYPTGTRVSTGRMEGTVTRHIPTTNAQGGHLNVTWDNGRSGRISPSVIHPVEPASSAATLDPENPHHLGTAMPPRPPKAFDPSKYAKPEGQLTRQLRRMRTGDTLTLPAGHQIEHDGLALRLRGSDGHDLDVVGADKPSLMTALIFHGPHTAALTDDTTQAIRDELADMRGQVDNQGSPGWVGVTNPARLQKLGAMIDQVALADPIVRNIRDRRFKLEDQASDGMERLWQLQKQLDTFLMDEDRPDRDRGGRRLGPERDAARTATQAEIQEVEQDSTDLMAKIVEATRQQKRAEREALARALAKIRPMGGKLNAEITGARGSDAQRWIDEAQQYLPTDWINDMNRAGITRFEVAEEQVRAEHRFQPRPASADPGTITREQQNGIDYALRNGGSYEGLYDGKWPVTRRGGTEEGGVGPYAAIYDWIHPDGTMRNLSVSAPGGYDETKWDRSAPAPPVQPGGRGDSLIPTSIFTTPDIYLHEILHRVQAVPSSNTLSALRADEAGSAVRSRAEYNYLTQRSGASGTPTQVAAKTERLADLEPDRGYKDYEVTIPDEWRDPYYGKVYGGSYSNTYNELLTMAMQDTFYNPRTLRTKDRDTYNWALGLLAAT